MRSLKLKMLVQQQLSLLAMMPLGGYLFFLVLGLEVRQHVELLRTWATWVIAAFGVTAPVWLIHLLTERALRRAPGEPPGARLRRILMLPRQIEMWLLLAYMVGDAVFLTAASAKFNLPSRVAISALAVGTILTALAAVRQTLGIEAVLRPLAVEEFERNPTSRPDPAGFLWPRQVWYFPYVMSLVVLSTTTCVGVILHSHLRKFLAAIQDGLAGATLGSGPPGDQLARWEYDFLKSMGLPMAATLGYVLVLGAITAVAVARRLRAGSLAVGEAVRGLASGSPALPRWPASDELGDLAFATAEALTGLQEKARTIAASALNVDQMARELADLVARQRQVVTAQATALQQSQMTADELKQASDLAADKSRAVLSAVKQAEQVSTAGREAVESNAQQLSQLLAHATEMAAQVLKLKERTRRIDRITLTVKEVADQTNMVALNAAIEAMRAGESGKTFSVVAQQIRRLSNESTTATEQAREMLRDVEVAVQEAAQLSDSGMSRAISSMALSADHGENLRRLMEIVESNAGSARQISEAVTQQAAGIAQIVEVLSSLGATMNRTVEAMSATEEIGARAERTAQEVAGAMAGYRWRIEPEREPKEPGPAGMPAGTHTP